MKHVSYIRTLQLKNSKLKFDFEVFRLIYDLNRVEINGNLALSLSAKIKKNKC